MSIDLRADPIPEPGLALLSFSGPTEFAQAVRDALSRAAAEASSQLILCDADFVNWPLGERSVIESLQQWAHSRRELRIYAHRYDAVIAKHHRFVNWRKQWQHIVRAWQVPSLDPAQFQSLLVSSGGFILHRVDPLLSRGVVGVDAARNATALRWLDELQDQASVGFPASVLGL